MGSRQLMQQNLMLGGLQLLVVNPSRSCLEVNEV
jgi:hypothetical protein